VFFLPVIDAVTIKKQTQDTPRVHKESPHAVRAGIPGGKIYTSLTQNRLSAFVRKTLSSFFFACFTFFR